MDAKPGGPDVPFENWFLPGEVLIMAMAFRVEIGFKLVGHQPSSHFEYGRLGKPSYKTLPLQKGEVSPGYCDMVRTHIGLCFWPEQTGGDSRGASRRLHQPDGHLLDSTSFKEILDDFLHKTIVHHRYGFSFDCVDKIGAERPPGERNNAILRTICARMETAIYETCLKAGISCPSSRPPVRLFARLSVRETFLRPLKMVRNLDGCESVSL